MVLMLMLVFYLSTFLSRIAQTDGRRTKKFLFLKWFGSVWEVVWGVFGRYLEGKLIKNQTETIPKPTETKQKDGNFFVRLP